MKKLRIFIHMHYLEIGGVETSLIGLLQTLDSGRADVDLFLNDPRGEMMRFIPEWVHLLPAVKEYTMIERPGKEAVRSGCFLIAAARLLAKFKFSRYLRKKKTVDGSALFGYLGKYVTPVLPDLKRLGEYDLAISYLMPHNIVLDKVRAKRKVCWIHTDYSRIDVDETLEFPVWRRYDGIVSISPDVTKSFISVFPGLKGKIVEIENFLPVEMIRKRASEFVAGEMTKRAGGLNLLTIGRYCYAKNLDAIPEICRRITEKGLDVKWYIIGYGSDEGYIRRNIVGEGMEDRVVLLGKRDNPYPYIQSCDIYVQPSRYEGKSITVREAQLLGKPVVITDYPMSHSQIEDGVDGFIGAYEPDAFAEDLFKILVDEVRLDRVRENLTRLEQNGANEIEKIYRLSGY